MKKLLFLVCAISLLSLSSCGKKKQSATTPTPVESVTELIDLPVEKQPKVSLVPREDGHELTLTLSQIDPSIEKIEYELVYTASDEGMEIEKGVNGVFDSSELSGANRKLLLGTESCTNGCKYKYDAGVTGGMVNLTVYLKNNQAGTVTYPFSLSSAADIKKTPLSLSQASFSVAATPSSTKEFYIALINPAKLVSIYSSGSGKAKINSINPSGTTKKAMNTFVAGWILER